MRCFLVILTACTASPTLLPAPIELATTPEVTSPSFARDGTLYWQSGFGVAPALHRLSPDGIADVVDTGTPADAVLAGEDGVFTAQSGGFEGCGSLRIVGPDGARALSMGGYCDALPLANTHDSGVFDGDRPTWVESIMGGICEAAGFANGGDGWLYWADRCHGSDYAIYRGNLPAPVVQLGDWKLAGMVWANNALWVAAAYGDAGHLLALRGNGVERYYLPYAPAQLLAFGDRVLALVAPAAEGGDWRILEQPLE